MPDNYRSQIVTQGSQRSPNRAMLRAVGFGDGDFTKPIVGIASGYSTITLCNMGINDLALRAEIGLKAAGAMPQLFGTITISDGISMGTEEMKYSLVSRELSPTPLKRSATARVATWWWFATKAPRAAPGCGKCWRRHPPLSAPVWEIPWV
jgi:dihydroxyacid dehydratase/phosphogluconate dehydratase